MKNLIAVISFLLFAENLYSQNKISFIAVAKPEVMLGNSFSDYKIFKLDDQNVSIADGLPIQIDCQDSYSFILDENRLLADNHTTIIKSSNGIEVKNVVELGFDGRYYHNKNSAANFQVAFSIFESQYLIYIKKDAKEFYLEPLKKFDENSEDDLYVYYEVEDIIDDGTGRCGTEDGPTAERSLDVPSAQVPSNCKRWDLNFTMDYSFYAQYNSVNAAINRTLEVLNLSRLNFKIANGLAYDVDFQVLQNFILTCNNCNYWPSTGDLWENANNNYLVGNWQQMYSEISDSRVFWQANLPPNDYNGLAAASPITVCPGEFEAYQSRSLALKNFLTDTPKTRFVLSHELGHNFTCDHTYSQNNIMGATNNVGIVNSWHNNSIATINWFLSTYTCIYDCANTVCHSKPVQNFNLDIDESNFSINILWTPEEDLTYKTRLYNYTTGVWSEYLTHDDTVSDVTYSLDINPSTCSEKYKIQITPYCGDVSGIVHTTVFNVPSCNLSNSHFQIPTVQFHPNPVKELFSISSQDLINRVTVYNIVGQKLLEREINEVYCTVDFSSFETSTYFLKVEFAGGARIIKVVKD